METLLWVLEWLFLRIIPTFSLVIIVLGPREWFFTGKPTTARSRSPYYEDVTELWYQSYDHDARLRSCLRSLSMNKSSTGTTHTGVSRVSFSNEPSIRHYSPQDRSHKFLKEPGHYPTASSLGTLVVKGCWDNSSPRSFRRSCRLNVFSTSKMNTPVSTDQNRKSKRQTSHKHRSILRRRATVPVLFSRKQEGPVEV